MHRKQTITCKGPSMDQGILEWSNEPFTENHMKLIQKLGSGWVEIHEGKILLTFSFEGPKHVMFGRARGAATHQQVKIESTRIEKKNKCGHSAIVTAPHTRKHQPLMQPAPQRNTTFLSKMTTAPPWMCIRERTRCWKLMRNLVQLDIIL